MSEALIESLLAECLDLGSDGQAAALATICARHPELADELRARFDWLHRSGLADEPTATRIPDEFSGFKLLQRLGGGGMGIVHVAEETALARRVALKTIRPEQLWFPGARERFFREVRTVAQLRHAAIVPVFAVGEHDGVPWFTMEWVHGCTLAELLRDLRELREQRAHPDSEGGAAPAGADAWASVRRRAEQAPDVPPPLFAGSLVDFALRVTATVADALAHAHAAGILHRDVKPSNVMVASDGRVLLLDFGLASTSDAAELTRSGSPLGSLPYMSPEQARGQPLDERSDVYSLGTTLYELLTLREAFGDRDATTTFRRVLAGDAPSARSLQRALPADVDAVCSTAMEVDRARRYSTAAAFRDDLRRLIDHRPIVARPPGPLLRARRFVQRHPTFAATSALLALVAAAVPTGFLVRERATRHVIEREARAADETLKLLEELLLNASPGTGLGPDTPVGALLEEGAKEMEERLRDRPDLRGRLLSVLARVRATSGDDAGALPLVREAIALRRAEPAGPDRDLGVLQLHLAAILARAQRLDEAERAYDEFLASADPAPDVGERVLLLAGRGQLLHLRGRDAEAERDLREAARIAEDDVVAEVARARAERNLGNFLLDAGRAAEALPRFEFAHALMTAARDPGNAHRVESATDLARGLLATGDVAAAATRCREALAALETQVPADSLLFVAPLRASAAIAAARGDAEAAERDLRRAVAIADARLPPTHTLRAWARNDLARRLLRFGRPADAAAAIEPALPIARAGPATDPAHLASILVTAADACAGVGRLGDAAALAAEAAQIQRSREPLSPAGLASALRSLAWIEFLQRDLDAAERDVRAAIERFENVASDSEEFGLCLSNLALIERARGRCEPAAATAARSIETLRAAPAADRTLLANAIYVLGWARLGLGERAQAEACFRESIAAHDAAFPSGHPLAAFPLDGLGVLLASDRPDEALPVLERALALRERTLAASDRWLLLTRHNTAAAFVRAKRDEQARPLFERNVRDLRATATTAATADELLAAGLFELARLHRRRDELDAAAEFARAAVEQVRALAKLENPSLLWTTKRLLGELLLALDEKSEGEALLAEARADDAAAGGK